jgi:Skp family chaperone for outer membrane proteins
MKKILVLIFFLTIHNYLCQVFAQDSANNRIEALKIAYITKELNLSPEEAQQFWPLYNQYSSEVNKARKKYPNDELAYEENVLNIRKKYQNQFKKVLVSGERVNKMYTMERNYRELLRNELRQRQQMRKQNNLKPTQP